MSAIVIAPYSNSAIRDWPAGHFSALIGLLLAGWNDGAGLIRVIGTAGQRLRTNAIVRSHSSNRVRNDCGRLPWPDVIKELRQATCVIGNNSGIAHLAGSFGVPTVCIFGGSHQRLEWRPLGFNVTLLSRSIGCSPCHLDHGAKCGNGLACLTEISPEEVAGASLAAIARAAEARADGRRGGQPRTIGEGVIT
jgi:ADP-heptose:LPS heptosyltransferase